MIGLAVFGWGLSTSFIEAGLPYMGPLQFLSYRFLITALVLTPFVLIQRRRALLELLRSRWMWYVAGWEATGLIVQYLGQERGVPAGLAALLSLLFILIVPFMSPIVLGEKLQPMHLVAAGIAFGGVALIAIDGDPANLRTGSIVGVMLLLGAAFSYASYIVATSRLRTREMPEVDTICLFYLAMVMVAIMTTIATVIFEPFQSITTVNPSVWIWIALLVLFSTLLAFFKQRRSSGRSGITGENE